MKPEEVKRIPMLGGDPDVIKALQLMPGIQGGREGAAGFLVRGGGPDQNLFLLDGTPIYNITHAMGFLSAFNPDIVRSISVTKGPGSARFGGRLSSVVDISLKEGDLNKRRIHGNIGTVGAIATVEGPIKKAACPIWCPYDVRISTCFFWPSNLLTKVWILFYGCSG